MTTRSRTLTSRPRRKGHSPRRPLEVLKSIIDFVWPLIDVLYLDLPVPTDDRKPKKIPLNEANFARKEFQELWGRINHRAVYQVEFDSAELIRKADRAPRQAPQRRRTAIRRASRPAAGAAEG